MQSTDEQFAATRDEFGLHSLAGVEEMTTPGGLPGQPLRAGAKRILPGMSQKPWHGPRSDPAVASLVDALESAHGSISAERARAWRTKRAVFSDHEHYLTRRHDSTTPSNTTRRTRRNHPRTRLLVDLRHPETTVPERQALTVLVTEVRKPQGGDVIPRRAPDRGEPEPGTHRHH
ncbi:hypothetical protein [Streptomyces sp. NPDC053720]|uniref:hypothetical protein n=1 Tax=Streptomyces sp. NPDC053720 TaxID=3154855 RepID=UPI0034211665